MLVVRPKKLELIVETEESAHVYVCASVAEPALHLHLRIRSGFVRRSRENGGV
jgi:hypothetical protein